MASLSDFSTDALLAEVHRRMACLNKQEDHKTIFIGELG